MLTLENHSLLMAGVPWLSAVPGNVTLDDGCWLRITQGVAAPRMEQVLGQMISARLMGAYRHEPFWMRPLTGKRAGEIPAETQFLFVELPGDWIGLIVPVVDGAMRCSLQGSKENGDELTVVAESGTHALVAASIRAVFIAAGRDLRELCESSAKSVAAALGTTLRAEKQLPAFAEDFGWCTWDAFYQDVSPEKIRAGLESFRAAGVPPKFLIIDDGWQMEEHFGEEKGRRLTGLGANAKFGGDLAPTARMAKQDFGVRHVLAWHALQGYWAGVDASKLPEYDARETARDFSPGVRSHFPGANSQWWGVTAGIIPPERIGDFFRDYHARLAAMGVDGVKVDNQAALEGLAGSYGRVTMYRQYHEALEQSVGRHFAGNLLNCMACANDLLYAMHQTALVRTSTDFWPDKPETHGLHVWTNAAVATWFGEFIWPDWDMFQSGHAWAEFHAAARVISGGPIYVSDNPGVHDAQLLRKLVLSDGTVLRCDRPGILTRDSLFADPLRQPELLKIWNTNRAGRAGVVGMFNCRYSAAGAGAALSGHVQASDVPILRAADGPFILHAVRAGRTVLAQWDEGIDISLHNGEAELIHVIPLYGRRAAVIGLMDKWNASAAVSHEHWDGDVLEFTLRDAGRAAIWCVDPPASISVDRTPIAWQNLNELVQWNIPGGGPHRVTMRCDSA